MVSGGWVSQSVTVLFDCLESDAGDRFGRPPCRYSQENTWEWYGDRCQITLTLMLTSVAYKFFIADQIPKVAYLTVLDWCGNFDIIDSSLAVIDSSLDRH